MRRYADRYVIGRENNVVLVNFTRPEAPNPQFPGAGALRDSTEYEIEQRDWLVENSQRRCAR